VIRSSYALGRRALRSNVRRFQFLFPLFVMPSLFLATNVGGLERTQDLPGFTEVHGFLDFQLAAAICQSMLIGGVVTGVAQALEIEQGFFDRLVASPTPRPALVFGRLMASGVLAVVQATFFLTVGLIFGAHIQSGAPGVLIVIALSVVAAVAFSALGMFLAFRVKNASVVQGIFPLVFVILFISSAFFPRELLEPPASWLAEYNPLSYIAEGLRDPIISEITASTVLAGFIAAGGLLVVFVLAALKALDTRLRDA
jgi:ABC-2 type transport system permease protein